MKEIFPFEKGPKMNPLIKYPLIALGIVGAIAFFSNTSKADQAVIDQVYTPVVQTNKNCSASIYQSAEVEGKVDTRLLTAKHCVKDKKDGTLTLEVTDKGKPIETRVVYYDRVKVDFASDLAMLKLRDTTHKYPTVKIADRLIAEIGDEVWVAGYPLGLIKTVTKGTLSGYHYFPERNSTFYQASPGLTFGNSGGALFQVNNGKYEQIGVTSMKFNENHFMNLFVPLEEIQAFLGMKPTEWPMP